MEDRILEGSKVEYLTQIQLLRDIDCHLSEYSSYRISVFDSASQSLKVPHRWKLISEDRFFEYYGAVAI